MSIERFDGTTTNGSLNFGTDGPSGVGIGAGASNYKTLTWDDNFGYGPYLRAHFGSTLRIRGGRYDGAGNVGTEKVDSNLPFTIRNQAANQVPLALQGFASQTADLQQWQNSAGTVLSKFDAGGNLSVGTSTSPTGGVATFIGNVGIGTASPGQELHVNGQIRYVDAVGDTNTAVCKNAAGDLANCTSLGRYKDNVVDLSLGLNELRRLRPVQFNWNSTGQNDLGFIAEEASAINPLLGTYDQDGNLNGVPYAQMTALLTRSIQEVDQRVLSLESGAASLDSRFRGNDNNFDPSEFNERVATSSALTNLKGKVDSQNSEIANLTSKISSLEASFWAAPESPKSKRSWMRYAYQDDEASSSAELGLSSDLELNNATIAENLNVLGRTTLSDVGITGKLSIGLLTLDGLSGEAGFATINTTSGPLKLQSDGFNGIDILDGKIVIDREGNMKVDGTVTVKKLNVDTSEEDSTSLGERVIKAGENTIEIKTKSVTSKSKIFVTPITDTDFPLIVIEKKAGESFRVKVKLPATQDVKFDWWIVN